MGDRVGPVGTGEAGSSGVGQPRVSPVNWTMTLDRQEALDGMDSTESAAGTDGQLDSLYLQNAAGHWRPPDASSSALLQGTLQSTFHLSQVLPSHSVPVEEEAKESLGLRGGPCGYSTVPDPSDSSSEGEDRAASLEPKYLSQTGQGEELDDVWSQCPDNIELDFQPGPTTTHNVVYQNEEGRWVTDLAYYSSFEKEAEMNLPEEIASQFQTEEFVSGNDALDKIIEDEEEFEKENQFIQEEQIAAQSSSLGLADTSWRLPSSNYILMRASQASSDFERGNQSYLRLSLGEFFQQRSEALGCLGDAEEDAVKRPSFGYVITSPEKREPFALIRPSDFSSRGSSVHSDTLHHSDADDTLHPEDLNKTFEATMEKLAHKEDEHSVGVEKEAAKVSLPHAPETAAAPGKCTDSPNNLLLSISTIATAIADASLSSDPAQLAAMILELSKKSRSKSQSPRGAGGMSQAVSPADQSVLLEALHKSVSAGELSSFDIEKYLRKTEASGSDSDCSASPHCFDILSWADSFRSSSKLFSPATPVRHEEPGAAAPHAGRNVSGMPQKSRKTSVVTPCSSAPPSVGPCKKSEGRRSTIPRPKASCIPTASASGSRRSVGKRPSTLSTQARLADTPGLNEGPEREAPSPVSSNRSGTETAARLGMAPVHTPSSGVAPSRSPASCSASSPSSPVPADSTLPSTWNGPPLQSQAPDPLRQGSDPREGETTCPFDKEPPGKSPAVFLSSMEKHQGFAIHSPQPGAQSNPGEGMGSPQQCAPPRVEESHCAFRPSTSPLTHSSPSQSSLPSADGMASCPASPASLKGGHDSLSPQSHCSSPSLSRLTYISLNNSTALPTPDRNKSNNSIALSTTIVRASPTPMVEQELPHGSPGDVLVQTNTLDLQSQNRSTDVRSLDCHYAAHSTARKGCEYNLPEIRERLPKRCPEPTPQHLTQGDSGYSSNLQQPGASDQQHPLHWASGTDKQELRGGFGFPVSFASDNPRFLPSSTFKPQAPHLDPQPSVPSLLTGRSLFSSQLAQQYLGAEVPLHPYHTGAATAGYGMCPVVSHANPPSVGHVHGPSASGPVLPQGYMNPSQLHRAHLNSLESGLLGAGKPYGHLGTMGMWPTAGFNDVGAQVVVPEELKFPNACCVGIASQTTLSIFNPTERWLQVGIAVTGLAIDGEKVESLPYQWLMVKNKTIIGPKSTEEQKVLFIPPRVGLYQCILSVSSWPTAAESEAAVQAQVFAKRVVLIAMAETPSLEVDVGTTGCLDFGDLSVGSARALPLKLINKTRATVPIRLVISANALAWRCFTFSKSPVAVPTDGMLQTGSVAPLAAPSVMNHVMHANYRDNPESFMVWVHFHAPQKYTPTSGALGPADEYCARVDIELDSPGPSQVIRSVQLRARSGTARVHAPKDLQTVSLISMLGKSSKQTLPLKNAGNINVQLKLKSSDSDDCFLVKPEELLLQAGEEQGITVCFTPKGTRKYRESVLTILVLPSGPQYEVVLKGEVAPEEAPRRFSASPSKAAHMDMPPAGTVPPILSNKQFMAWGGVTLGRAVQQKLVLRNNSPSAAQQLRLLVRGQDQDCFQLQSTFGPGGEADEAQRAVNQAQRGCCSAPPVCSD
ncbi:hypothetical protein AGOR_G00112400 [Albula goreensis]|uniref:Centrosomal protein of 192 kDa n=1 Tax=Albula goreensis TaxID=1534307 RepID=A0A8T3DID6_9TELE|nr:hypothetical protein AGOR_G00112400 [Albula goreensis]